MIELIERYLPLRTPEMGDGGGDSGGDTAPTETPAVETPEITEGEEGAEVEAQPEEEEFEDFEANGQKHKIPKKYMDAVRPGLMMQGDYTQKTQSLQAKSQLMDQYANASAEKINKVGELNYAHQMVQRYAGIDWNTLRSQDLETATARSIEWQQWRDRVSELQGEIANIDQQSLAAQQGLLARRQEEAVREVQRDIPNWNSIKSKVGEFAVNELGYSPQELATISVDPRAVKLIHRAWKGSQYEAAQKAAAAKKPAEEAAPTPATRAVRGNANAQTGLRDNMPIDDWMKARNKQLRQH